ncbi:MAG: carbohydrate-binding protein [Clostridium sp.]|nr:carbohydrate-binding protein [Clostridium sp.]MCM1547617.1 carbohydrate-binding protein [Ruminococcus sp.]
MKLKKGLAFLTSLVTIAAVNSYGTYQKPEKAAAANAVIAFPGAVGGGKYATGGRGGEVYHVTNLNDSGAGSFRDAVSKSNRIVVFDVSGTIELKSNILCQSNVTVAGQTAPGGSGITLKNYKMGMSGDNIICRYISSRPGPYASTSSGNDAWGGAAGSNSIIDHCSMGWTTDEQWGLYSNNMNYTVQYSVLGPADSWGGHKKGLHGFGLMMGKGNLSFDHNLIIHNVSRNFRGKVQDTYTADFTNNIIYDWGYQTAYGTIGHLNYVNNTLKAGNSTTGGYHWMYVDSGTKPENFKVYCDGNQLINKDGSLHDITNDNWSGVTVKTSIGITKDDLYSAEPFSINSGGENISSVSGAESAEDSYDHVVSFAGNGITPEKRTAVDRQCAEETVNGTGSCSGTSAYDSTMTDLDKYSVQCGVTYEYPSAVLTKEIIDTDNDGMPDEWEEARGLDPNDASDTNGDYCGQGYTNIEYYINDLTIGSFPEGVVALSPETTTTPAISAFEKIEAENFSSQEGVKAENLTTGGQNIGFIENGDYIMFRKVDFEDGARSFKAVISGNASNIEFYLNSITGTPAATINFAGTSGFNDYQEIEFNIPKIEGVNNLYMKFTGGEGYLLNMDSFVFGREAIPLNGKLIKNLVVKDETYGSKWAIAEKADIGSLIFGDRDFTFTELPETLRGSEIIKTACDSKYTASDLAEFNAGDSIDVYVALDNRVEAVPEWMSNWEKTDMTCKSSNDVTFDIYKKSVSSGDKVMLGTNGQSNLCVNYAVMAVSSKTEPIGLGDINFDGKSDSSDLEMLQKYIIKKASLTAGQCKAADINSDGIINVCDVVLLKRMIIK